ncbi:PFA5 [Candida theae]|uniref:Palmitoyltransferase n=1 Tax=Candida theae TaxID=1198502 RepID=A0AAD5BEE5_9ASCO|nr:PFA5 [Candida theae]KAI5957761.1 PFA5 [Candida theae]
MRVGTLQKIRMYIVPLGIIVGLGYLNFALNYSLGYQEIYNHHSHGVAITLWCLSGFCQVLLFIYWALILYVGPGRSPQFPLLDIYQVGDKDLLPLPDVFFCDEFGFPFYDSKSQSLRIERSFYSKYVGYNVLKFDHFCLWIGSSIGLTNYLYFMKFCIWFMSFFIIMLIYISRYTRSSIDRGGEINHNFILLYIMSGFWILCISALFIAHVGYVCRNVTTLDEISIKQKARYERWRSRQKSHKNENENENENEGASGSKSFNCLAQKMPRKEEGKRYVNVKRDNLRLVVEYDVSVRPFNMGWKRNWINLVLNGNRTQGRDEGDYTTARFIEAMAVLLLPFAELPFELRRRRAILDLENLPSGMERTVAEFKYYSSEVSPEFLQVIEDKINRRDCYIPSYFAAKNGLA